jgi:catechol 2,3-dioxygenase-like lactoylglutathione lyase family enzyme
MTLNYSVPIVKVSDMRQSEEFYCSVLGFRLILDQIEDLTEDRAVHGRVHIGLVDRQLENFRRHVDDNGIRCPLDSVIVARIKELIRYVAETR